jgi:hypothetical protein
LKIFTTLVITLIFLGLIYALTYALAVPGTISLTHNIVIRGKLVFDGIGHLENSWENPLGCGRALRPRS